MTRAVLLLAITLLSVGAAGCDRDDIPGAGGPGLSVSALRDGEDGDCPFTDRLRAAMDDAGMPNDITPLKDNEVAYQDERDDDSADSTVLGDTDGAHLLCKFRMDDDVVELDSYYLDDPDGRSAFTTAVAWQLILGGVSESQIADAQDEYGEQLGDAKPGDTLVMRDPFEGAGDGTSHEVMAIVRGRHGGSAAIALHVQSADPSVTDDSVEQAVKTLAKQLSR